MEIKPRIYGVDADFGFNGSVVIEMTSEEATDVIVLHGSSLTLNSDSITLR